MPTRLIFPQDAGPTCPIFELSKSEGHPTSRPTWKICLIPDVNNDLVGTDSRGRKEPLMAPGTMQLAPQPITSYYPGGSQQVVVRDEDTLQELRVIKTQLHTHTKELELHGKRQDAIESKLEKHDDAFDRILDRMNREEEERKKEKQEEKKEKKREKKERMKEKERSDQVMTMLLEQLKIISQREAEKEERRKMKELTRDAAAARFMEDVALRERVSRPTEGGVGVSSHPHFVEVEGDDNEAAEAEEAEATESADVEGAEAQEVADEGEAAQTKESQLGKELDEEKELESGQEREKTLAEAEASADRYILDEPMGTETQSEPTQPSEEAISIEKAAEEATEASVSTELKD